MKPRSSETTVIGAGLALFVVLSAFFIFRSADTEERFPPLSSYSHRPNGTLALYELLEAAGQPVDRHLQSQYDYPAGAAVVVLDQSLVDANDLIFGGMDSKALSLWMRSGGTLVIAASAYSSELTALFEELSAQADSPLHQMNYGLMDEASRALVEAAGIATGSAAHDRAGLASPSSSTYGQARTAQSGEIFKLTQPAPELFSGVLEIETAQTPLSSPYPGVALLEAGAPPQPLLVWLPVGSGGLYWLSVPEIAANDWIGRVDNHRLLLNVLTKAANGGTLWFDEHRHGYREQGPTALGLIFQTGGGRLLLALLLLCALAFAGSAIAPARFHPALLPARRQSTEMVLAQGSLYQRAGVRRPVAEHLLDGLRQAIRQHEHWATSPDDQRLGRWLHDAAGRGLPVDPLLLKVVDGQTALGTERQLWLLARAVDRLRAAL